MRWLFNSKGGFNWTVLLVIAVVCIAVTAVINQFIYDDWRCLFAECRIVKQK